MGKKLDRLLGRGFRASKFKSLLKLIVSRVAILQKRHNVRVSQSRSDVAQLLRLGHHDRALGRVEQVIRELNMLDMYAMVGGYCGLLAERVGLIEREKFCPEVLKEAMSSLIFAASRCGELPELQEVRRSLASRYGQEFAAQAVDLRNGCAVSPEIIQKLSARPPPLETRINLIREIASENHLPLPLKDPFNLGSSLGASGSDDSLKRDPHFVESMWIRRATSMGGWSSRTWLLLHRWHLNPRLMRQLLLGLRSSFLDLTHVILINKLAKAPERGVNMQQNRNHPYLTM